ncbi:MAG: hypothetical protein Q4G68_06315 [Planctomycetia bacterium]|nr:hypothetical protein [Planctomycetia bacterium]
MKNALFFRHTTGLILVTLLMALLFHDVLWGGRAFAFRDESYFYNPLYEQIQNSLTRGELPLWDPSEHLGMPLLANPVAAVCYPLKVIFFLPSVTGITYQSCFVWYILLHVLLAVWGMTSVMGRWGRTPCASWLAGLSYAFGGCCVSQYCNVIYLVGAAWLPWAILAGDMILRRPRPALPEPGTPWRSRVRGILGLAFVLAMMVLGGEPQIAYLTGLILLGLAFCYDRSRNGNADRTLVTSGPAMLLYAAILAVTLAAVQILPAWDFARGSDRAFSNGVCALFPNEFSPQTYRFSVPPWHWLEYLWPSFGGRLLPVNSRWLSLEPNDERWFLTLYQGVIAFLLALSVFRLRLRARSQEDNAASNGVGRAVVAWSSWLLLLSLLAALGGYGPHWFYKLVRFLSLGQGTLRFESGDPVGGLYWLLHSYCPLFALFRYPAKLLILASFATATLAGFGWDSLAKNNRIGILSLFVLLLSIVCLGVTTLGGPSLFASDKIPSSGYFGSYDAQTAYAVTRSALVHATLVVALFLLILKTQRRSVFFKQADLPALSPRRAEPVSSPAAGPLLLILVAFDLFFAIHPFIITAPRSLYEYPATLRRVMSMNEKLIGSDDSDLLRFLPVHGMPDVFDKGIARNRSGERLLWESLSFTPKHHTRHRLASLVASGTMCMKEYPAFCSRLTHDCVSQNDAACLAFLDTRYLLTGQDVSEHYKDSDMADLTEKLLPCLAATTCDKPVVPVGLRLWGMQTGTSRLHIFHSLSRELSDPDFSLFDLVERGITDQRLPGETAEILAYKPNRIEMRVSLRRKADLVLADQYEHNWRLYITATPRSMDASAKKTTAASEKGQEVPVARTLEVLRRFTLDAGQWHAVMCYEPVAIRYGAAVSVASWLLLICGTVVTLLPRQFLIKGRSFFHSKSIFLLRTKE